MKKLLSILAGILMLIPSHSSNANSKNLALPITITAISTTGLGLSIYLLLDSETKKGSLALAQLGTAIFAPFMTLGIALMFETGCRTEAQAEELKPELFL